MPAWRDYSERDLRDLVVYVQRLPRGAENNAPLTPAEMTQVNTVFEQNCASCHGDRGNGLGAAAAALAPAPTNSHLEQPSSHYALQVLAHGVPGSAMPGWSGQLSQDDRQLLARYVRSLFRAPVAEARTREQQISSLKEVGR